MSETPIRRVRGTNYRSVSASTTAGAALGQLGSARALLVLADEDGLPLGVAAKSALARLDANAPVAEQIDDLDMPTLLQADTSLGEVLQIMAADKASRWMLAMEGQEVVRLIDGEAIFEQMRETQRGGSLGDAALFGDTRPQPLTYYVCTDSGRHCYASTQIQQRSPRGRALCPDDGTAMTKTNFACS